MIETIKQDHQREECMSLLRRNPKNPNGVDPNESQYGSNYAGFGEDEIQERTYFYRENRGIAMIITHEVEDLEEWRKHKDERWDKISEFADDLVEYSTENTNVMALSFFVPEKCIEKLEEQIKDNSEMLKQMVNHGVKIETIKIFYEFDDS